MTSRHSERHGRRLGPWPAGALCALALLAAGTASADENFFHPFEIPEDTEGLPDLNSSLPDFVGTDGSATAATPAQPAAPAMPAPRVDAYLDVAFNDSDLSAFGFDPTPGGYRFTAGFIFRDWSGDRYTLAPEVSLVRIGRAEEETVTSVANYPIPQYDNVTTVKRVIDMSTLAFGVRAGYSLTTRLEAFARTGLNFYHDSRQEQTTYSYVPLPPNTAPRPDDPKQTLSVSDVGTDYFLSGGLAWKVGQVPSVYAEYGVYAMGTERVRTGTLGVLMNF